MGERSQKFSFIHFLFPNTTKKIIWIFIILGFVTYSNSLFNKFVWDDVDQIPSTHTGNVSTNIERFFLGFHYSENNAGMPITGFETYYKPLFYTTLATLYGLFGNSEFYYHVFQVSLHIVDTYLVFIVLSYFLRKELSFLLSLIFLVHPINVESVIYVSALQEPLFFFFGMSAFVLLNTNRLDARRLQIGGVLMLLSLLSKESGYLFILIVGLFHFIYRRSTFLKILSVESIVLGVYLTLHYIIAQVHFVWLSYVPIMKLPFIERLYSVPKIFFYYMNTFFYPKELIIAQHWVVSSPGYETFYLPLLLDLFFLSVIVGFGIYIWKTKRDLFLKYLFFGLWFFIGMGLYMQIAPLDMTVAERWFYFPIVGLLGLFGILLESLKWIERYKSQMITLFFITLSLLSLRTIKRNFDWKNPMTLYLHDIQHNNSSFNLESILGSELFKAGKVEEAKYHFERSIELAPEHWVNMANLAAYYYYKKDYVNAEKYYLISIKNNPYFKPSYGSYAKVLLLEDETGKKAKAFLEENINKFPQDGNLWLYLAVADYKQGLKDEALIEAKKAVQFAPNNQSVYVYNRINNDQPLIIE